MAYLSNWFRRTGLSSSLHAKTGKKIQCGDNYMNTNPPPADSVVARGLAGSLVTGREELVVDDDGVPDVLEVELGWLDVDWVLADGRADGGAD